MNYNQTILNSCSKKASYNSEDSCDAILSSLNSHLKEVLIKMLVEAEDIPIFADEATSAAQKEMMGLFISVFDEESTKVVVEFLSLVNLASTKSVTLMEKHRL